MRNTQRERVLGRGRSRLPEGIPMWDLILGLRDHVKAATQPGAPILQLLNEFLASFIFSFFPFLCLLSFPFPPFFFLGPMRFIFKKQYYKEIHPSYGRMQVSGWRHPNLPDPSLVFSLDHPLSPCPLGYLHLTFVRVSGAVFHMVILLSRRMGVLLVYHLTEAWRSLTSSSDVWPRSDTQHLCQMYYSHMVPANSGELRF